MIREKIRLNVCQGVGDIFWVYQKFSPYYEKIDFCIRQVPNNPGKIQNRAIDFLKLLPKVDLVTTKEISHERYNFLASNVFSMKNIFQRNKLTNDYSCNYLLEQGVKLREIDPEYPIEETVDIRIDSCPLAFSDFITIYVSGGTSDSNITNLHKVWTPNQWVEFINLFYEKYKINYPIIQIGASYDMNVLLSIEEKLKKNNYRVHTYIDAWAANVIYILQKSKCFIGYQSGLNVLADNVNTKQLMLYYPQLEKMKYTWCKKDNEKTLFHADLFTSSPCDVISNLKLII